MFKLWALCVEKCHQQDSELELAYLWYVLLEVAHLKGNVKLASVAISFFQRFTSVSQVFCTCFFLIATATYTNSGLCVVTCALHISSYLHQVHLCFLWEFMRA
jgi:hypothetical protein